jgi:uncharacterized protein YcfJ
MSLKTHTIAALLAGSLFVTACVSPGASYRPIVDGPYDSAYEADLSECQKISRERDWTGDERRSGMLAGALLGGLFGLFSNNSDAEDVADAALAGAVLGGLDANGDVQDDRQDIVINCMDHSGYVVLG